MSILFCVAFLVDSVGDDMLAATLTLANFSFGTPLH